MLYLLRCVVFSCIILSLILFCVFYATQSEQIGFAAAATAYLLVGLTIMITTTLFFCKSEE
jgi:hypothetical protein